VNATPACRSAPTVTLRASNAANIIPAAFIAYLLDVQLASIAAPRAERKKMPASGVPEAGVMAMR
jgi:hypothetical protein